MEALILAGGLGTRLASVVADRAKPVATVAGRPFLAYVLTQLERCARVGEVVLCVGHKKETVEAALGRQFGRLRLRYSSERSPLGTGGALRLALRRPRIPGPVLAMNGDSFLGIRLDRLIEFHEAGGAKASVALARVREASRYGSALLSGDRVVGFREKGPAGPAWINAGIYVLSPQAVTELAEGPRASSFETGALAAWCAGGQVRGLRTRARFIDIGVPADYKRSASVLRRGG